MADECGLMIKNGGASWWWLMKRGVDEEEESGCTVVSDEGE